MSMISIQYEPFRTFEIAAAAAGKGYSDELLLKDASFTKFDASIGNLHGLPDFMGPTLASFGMVAAERAGQPVRVLDVGGALAGHYGIVSTAFRSVAKFDWTVQEQKLYVDYGNRFAATAELRFVSRPEEAPETVDLAYFSGVLQYLGDPAAVLSAEALRKAAFVLITRTPTADDEEPFLQTVTYDFGTVQYPGRVLPLAWLKQRLAALGYDEIASWDGQQSSVGGARRAPALLWRKVRDADSVALASMPALTGRDRNKECDVSRHCGFRWPDRRPDMARVRWLPNIQGRDPIVSLINQRQLSTMIEVGSFLGGGALHWLESCPSLSIYGVDEYSSAFNVAEAYVASRDAVRPRVSFPDANELDFILHWSKPGVTFQGVLSNLWDMRDRFTPVRKDVASAFNSLHRAGVLPDLIDIQSLQDGRELSLAKQLWPNALIIGSGWGRVDAAGRYPVRESAFAFAGRHDMGVAVCADLWILEPPGGLW